MSLLVNEEFSIYRLRLGYLTQAHDGVGDRLLTLNTNVLNEPAFRAAGWTADAAAIKRCHSPPIPTTGAAEYFNRPLRPRKAGGLADESPEETYGGLISGHRGSEDMLGPTALTEKERRRRKQGMLKQEEDDSSDLSDDSDDETTEAQGVRFAKAPSRTRANTSPLRNPHTTTTTTTTAEGPELKIISPSYRPRTSSFGATEAILAANSRTTRPRRDTTTSSEMSSDNEGLDVNGTFRRKLPSRPQKSAMLSEKIAEEEPDNDSELEDEYEEDDVEVAEASDLSDESDGDEPRIVSPELPGIDDTASVERSKPPPHIPRAVTPGLHTRQKSNSLKEDLPKLPKLPPGRPISAAIPASLLSMALKGPGGTGAPEKPYQKFAEFSGKGDPQPLWIKIYAPFSKLGEDPILVPLRRARNTDGGVPTVNELIGLALWSYDEEDVQPNLTAKESKIESWELRMVEDGEVDMDFPALGKSRPVTDFTSNNNRPPQRRARDKPWDEFGLVRADNAVTTSDDESTSTTVQSSHPVPTAPAPLQATTTVIHPMAPPSLIPNRNPITGPAFVLSENPIRKGLTSLLDAPQASNQNSTPRTGASKTVKVHFTDPQSFQTQLLDIPTTADTYIAELFDVACARLRLDKALYVFKVRGTQTVAPSDRTVEALGTNLHLDLMRRRFGAVGDFGLGLSGSPGSDSPNAPLELVPNTPPSARDGKKKRKGFGGIHPLQQQQQFARADGTIASSARARGNPLLLDLAGASGEVVGRRYHVLRKLPLSFSGSHPRTLIITPEYMQILPATTGAEDGMGGLAGGYGGGVGYGGVGGKVTNVPMSSIVGVKVSRKHPKMMRVLVYRERETKRYDFECASHAEAESIVGDIRVGLEGVTGQAG